MSASMQPFLRPTSGGTFLREDYFRFVAGLPSIWNWTVCGICPDTGRG
jgi:hypothetical protein